MDFDIGFDVYRPSGIEMVAVYATIVAASVVLVPAIIVKGAFDNLTSRLCRRIM